MNPWIVFALAILCGLISTWMARAAAWRVGLVDRPDGRRKIHDRPIAVAGGLAVFFAVIAALAIASALNQSIADQIIANPARMVALFGAALVIAAVGLLDDLINLRARQKLLGQFLAIALLIYPGELIINQIGLFGHLIHLGLFAIPVTVLWFLAAVNAVNLLDGMDGLLGTIGIIVAGALAWMAFAAGHPFVGWVAVALAGSLVGFLRFNFPPATVYLGDCGSMLIGLTLSALAIEASLKGPTVAIAGPLALLVLPILDTTAAVVRRQLTGRGLAAADRGHIHHVLQKSGLTRPRVLALVAALGVVSAGGAIASIVFQNDFLAALAAAAVVLILLASGLFGTAEVRLVRERAVAIVRATVRRSDRVELTVQLQGTADWAGVWQGLVRAADEMRLRSLRLDVNAPAWHEGFHGRWDRACAALALDVWRLDLPVFGHGQVIGRLTVAGVRTDTPMTEVLARISDVLAEAEAAASSTVLLPASIPVRPNPDPTPLLASASV